MSAVCCIILASSMDSQHNQNVKMIEAFCTSRNIKFEEIDGADPVNKELRTSLFEIAERNKGRRQYPMFFAMHSDRTISFIGNLEEVQDLIDSDDTDPAILAQCPEAPTFSRVFYPV
ncbi:hypothetical protein WA171_003896, partial [Blastocystis sp. BT1]